MKDAEYWVLNDGELYVQDEPLEGAKVVPQRELLRAYFDEAMEPMTAVDESDAWIGFHEVTLH